jgi:hypothetical protein
MILVILLAIYLSSTKSPQVKHLITLSQGEQRIIRILKYAIVYTNECAND